MKNRIEEALRVLVGLPMWSAGRAGNLEWFEFGARRIVIEQHGKHRGEQKEVGEYALHVQCTWRITHQNGIVVGSHDRYYPRGERPFQDSQDFEWDQPGANRCDER